MKDIVEYLDRIGHKLGIGGFEGVIGALVLSLATLVIFSQYFSLLRGPRVRKERPTIQREGHIRNPLEWSEDPEKTIGWNDESKAAGPKLKLCLISMVAIGTLAALSRCMR
jgi:hypothetical protein